MATRPEVAASRRLARLNLTLAVAESCTGGLVAHRFTNVAGSSAGFWGGVVAYTPEVKTRLLGVPRRTITTYGVVSPQVAVAMARGVRRLLGTTIGLGVTGVAGPGPGDRGEPEGLIYLGISAPGRECAERHRWHAGRVGNKRAAATALLEMLAAYLADRDKPGAAARL